MMLTLLVCMLAQPVSTRLNPDDEARRLFAAIRSDWERWASAADTFRKDGADPGPWGLVRSGAERFELIAVADFPNLRHVVGGHMVPLTDPLAEAKQLVEVRLNASSYDFIRSQGLYTVDGQRRAVTAGQVNFPPGAIQLKAGWRPITETQRNHYHTMQLRLADGETRLLGLVAINFAAKTSVGWLWASFEHVDIRDDDARASATGWGYYRLRGAQTAFVDAAGRPVRLGNAELEAGLGESASCMTCHARAAIGSAGRPERLPVFAAASAGVRRGYVGVPNPAWFGHAGAQGRWQVTYAPLDFVWSLAQAAEHGPPGPAPTGTVVAGTIVEDRP
jgi:hypothetical protein